MNRYLCALAFVGCTSTLAFAQAQPQPQPPARPPAETPGQPPAQTAAQLQTPAYWTPTVKLYAFVEDFQWKETANGLEFVKENGPLFGLGLELSFGKILKLELGAEGFYGKVDYDGFLQDPAGLIPYKAKTEYVGSEAHADLGLMLRLGSLGFKPYAGAGVRAWSRQLGKDSQGLRSPYGYDEYWLTAYSLVGLGAELPVGRTVLLGAKAELRVPMFNKELVDLSNVGGPSDAQLDPGKQAGFYGEFNATVRPVTFAVFIETLSFSESPPNAQYQILQPKSENLMFGIKLGLAF